MDSRPACQPTSLSTPHLREGTAAAAAAAMATAATAAPANAAAAAMATGITAVSKKGITAASKAAPAPPTAVAATYCEAAMATLPTAAAPQAAAEVATRVAAKKDVVAMAMASSAGGGYEPVPACPAHQVHTTGSAESGPNRMEAERMCAIPQFDGEVSLGSEMTLQPATPPSATSPPPTAPSLPSEPATVKKLCSLCTVAPILNYKRRMFKECLEKLVCKKYLNRSPEYSLQYHFFRYIYEY